MNFDDKFTKELEEKFEKNLEAIRGMPPEAYQQINESLNVISEFVDTLSKRPFKLKIIIGDYWTNKIKITLRRKKIKRINWIIKSLIARINRRIKEIININRN